MAARTAAFAAAILAELLLSLAGDCLRLHTPCRPPQYHMTLQFVRPAQRGR